jgi:hypothetical protein
MGSMSDLWPLPARYLGPKIIKRSGSSRDCIGVTAVLLVFLTSVTWGFLLCASAASRILTC